MNLRQWTAWSVCVLVGAFIISSAQADTLTNVFSATMTLNGYIDSFFDGSGNPLPGVVVKVDPMPLNSEAPLSASSTKAPQAYHPSAFNQRGIMSAYNPFVNGGTIYIGVDLPGGDGSPANPNYTDAKGPTRGTAGPGGMPAIVPFDADGDGLAQSIGTNTISGTDMKRCSDMGTTDIIDCGLQINAGFTDAATDAGVIENYSANVTFGDGTFVTVNLFESQSTGVGLARLQQCGGCPPAIADETAGKTFGAAASTASGGTLNGAPLGLDVEFAITNVNANVDACNRLIQTVSVNSGSNSDGNDNGEDFNTLSVNYVLPATLSCDVLFFTNQTTRITTNGCGTAAPVGVKLGDQVTISVVVSAASTNAQNISSYTVNISGVGSITVNSPLAPGQSATNVVGTFTCNAPGVNTFQATVNGVGAITASCFPINTDCSATLQCCGNVCVKIFKSIACFPAGGGDCSSIAPSSYSKSATGYKTDAGDPAFCYRVTVTNCGNVALQNVVVVDDHQGTLTFSTSLPVNGTETHYFFASHDTNTMNTVQVDADGAFGTGPVMGSDNANAVVIPANITCNVSLSSPDDQDGKPGDNHVSLPNDGNAHNVTFSVSVTAGNASLVAVTLTSAELSALNCTLPAPFSLAANNTTNIVICTQGILCQQSGSINVHVQGNIDESGGVCARTSEPFLLNVISDCSGNIDCLSCPTCTISGPTAVCAGTKGSTFTVTPSAAGVAINWSITGNGTITSGTNGLSVTADAGAASMFTLTAKVSANGCTNTCNWPVTVNPNPTCSITGPTPVCAGTSGNVYASTATAGATHSWTISGNGTIVGPTTNASVSVTAGAAGTFTVTDNILLAGCPGSCSKTVTVNPNPTCSITGPTPVCAGTSGNVYTSTANAGATHSWTISGNGTIVGLTTNASVSVTAGAAGTFTVTDNILLAGCPGSCSKTVTVNPNPTCSITGPTPVCAGTSGNVYASTATAGATHSWTISGNGTIVGSTTNASVSVTAGAAGTFTVTDNILLAGCPGSCSQTVTVNPNPTCSITGPTPVCAGTSGNVYTSTANAGATHSWTISGNGTIVGPTTNASVSVTAGAAGTFTVTDNILLAGCPGSCSKTVTVNPNPTCSITGPTPVCAGTSGNVYTSTANAGATHSWTISGNGTIVGSTTNASVSVTAGAAGTFTLTDAILLAGCPGSCSLTVTVNQNSSCSITGPTPVCAGTSGNVYASTATAGATHSWTISGNGTIVGPTTNASVSVTAGAAGTFTVTDNILLAGCPGSCSKTVTVNPNPTCSITGPTPVCAGTSGNVYTSTANAGATHSWTISGNGTIVGLTTNASVSVTAGAAGTFTVTDNILLAGCPGSCSKTVTVNPNPTCSITGPTPVCAGTSGNVYASTATAGATHSWTISGNGTIVGSTTNASVSVTAGAAGTFTVTDNILLAGCPGSCSQTVTVNPTGSIGDFVWNDLNGNGCQDPGEPGIAGVQVSLYSGACGTAGNLIATTNTDSTGHYLFSGLCPGNYQVAISTPAGYTNTTANMGCTNPNLPPDRNQLDSKCNCAGASPCILCVTLTASNPNNLNVDCGYVCNGQIGDFIWNDVNGNGCQDAGEPGIPGVQVSLYSGVCGGTSTLIATTNTDSTGHYLFSGLCPGSYQVAISTPAGYTNTTANVGCTNPNLPPDRNQLDSKCNCAGASPCVTCVTLTPANPINLNVDCGYKCNGQIGDYVWNDANGNGCQDTNEVGIAGVQVSLYSGACGSTPTLIATTNTDSTGHYLFSGLCPGNYQVSITTPAGYTNTTPNVGCTNPNLPTYENGLDSKCNCAGASPCITCVTLTPANPVNLNIDCGYKLLCPPCVPGVVGGINLSGIADNYLFFFANGSTDANWQGATKGFAGNVVVSRNASFRTSGTVPYAGTIYTDGSSLGQWQQIVNQNSGQAFASFGNTALVSNMTAKLIAAIKQINALPVTPGFESVSAQSLNGLNTTGDGGKVYVINVTSGFQVSSQINITGDTGDVFILRWDTDANPANGYQGQVKFQSGGAIVPHGGLTPSSFINVAGDINSSGGGSNPPAPYPQGPRLNNGTGALINGASNFGGGGFFTGYWLTTGAPTTYDPVSGLYIGDTAPQSNGIFVGGWYSLTTKFSMTSGTSGVYVGPTCPPCPTPTPTANCVTINAVQGVAIMPVTMVGIGGCGGPYTFTAVGLPSNLTMSSSGTISGTPTATGTFNYTVTVTDNCGNIGTVNCSVTVGTTSAGCAINGVTISNTSWNKFNIPNGSSPVVWVHAHIGTPTGIPKTGVTTVQFTGVTINLNGTPYSLPNSVMTFDPSAPTTISTTYSGGQWQTLINPNNLSDEMFFTGAAIPVTAAIAAGAKATLSYNVQSSVTGLSFSWQWSAAVYTYWPADWNQALIQPYHQGDHAGTPENPTVQKSLIQGPRGGGGSNYTGSWSATGTATCLP